MFKQLLAAVLCIVAISHEVAYAAADDISRLYTFTSGTVASSSQVNSEFNQLITSMNAKFGRSVDNTITGNNTFSGTLTQNGTAAFSAATTFSSTATFSDSTGVKTNTLTERSANSGISITGFIKPIATTQAYTPAAAGEFGYDSTNNLYKGRENTTNVTFLTTASGAASQANQEAASSTTVYTSPGTQKYHPGNAKAWVQWNGTGTTIVASYNVTSVTHPSTGNGTVTITTPFSGSTVFACIGSAIAVSGVPVIMSITNYTSSTVDFNTKRSSDNANTDSSIDTMVCFGDQ